MLNVTSEHAFETYVEEMLLEQSEWHKLPVAGWDKANAYFPQEVLGFIQRTQGPLWQQMHKLHGAELEPKLLDTLRKELDLKGTLHVLRHGFKKLHHFLVGANKCRIVGCKLFFGNVLLL